MKVGNDHHGAIFSSNQNNSPSPQPSIQQKDAGNWTPLHINKPQSVQENPHVSSNNQTQASQDTGMQSLPKPPVKAEPQVIMQNENHKAQSLPASQVSPELLRIKGSWPFDLAPDELIIEEKRIIIKRNHFPFGGELITLPLKRLVSFEVSQAFFYSAVYIKGEGNTLNTIMQWLKPEDALRAKEVIDGLRLKESEDVQIKTTDKKKIVDTLQSIGHT